MSPSLAQAIPDREDTGEQVHRIDSTDIVFDYSRFVLDNGLTVLVHTDHSNPSVYVAVYYRVGSKDEPEGRHGFAHLFEHLMFHDTANRPGDYLQAIADAGISDANGATSEDYTIYHQTVPINALDTVLWLESDRMGYLAGGLSQEVLDEQRSVVLNEMRQGGEEPQDAQAIRAAIYPEGHPYAHLAIGEVEDLDAATLDDARGWFAKYYGASNAVLVLSGDIDAATARAKAARFFADVPAGERPAEPDRGDGLAATRKEAIREAIPGPVLTRVWSFPHASPRERAMLSLASQSMLLPGPASVREALTAQGRVADAVAADFDNSQLGGTFSLSIPVRPSVTIAQAETALDEAVAAFARTGPDAQKLRAIALATDMATFRLLEDSEAVGNWLGSGEVLFGNPLHTLDVREWTAEATPAQISAAAAMLTETPFYQIAVLPEQDEATGEEGTGAGADTGAMYAPRYRQEEAGAIGTASVDRTRMPDPGPFVSEVEFPPITEMTLDNGLKVVVAERHSAPLVDAYLRFPTGSLADADYVTGSVDQVFAQLSHATQQHSEAELAQAREDIAMRTSSATAAQAASFGWSTLTRFTEEGFALAAEMVRAPAFSQEALDSFNERRLAAYDALERNPASSAGPILLGAVWGRDDPRGSGIIPRDELVPVTLADLQAFHAREIGPQGATLYLIGDITPERAEALAEEFFGDWSAPAPTPLVPNDREVQTGSRVILRDVPGAQQSLVMVGQAVPAADERTALAESVADQILAGAYDSRINRNLRLEKGWTYGFGGGINDALAGQRLFSASGTIQTEQTAPAMAEILAEMRSFVGDNPIGESELERQKAVWIRAIPASLKGNDELVASMIDAADGGRADDAAATLGDRIEAVTLDEARAAARRLYRPDNLVWVVIGDLDRVGDDIRALDLGPVEVVDAYGDPVR